MLKSVSSFCCSYAFSNADLCKLVWCSTYTQVGDYSLHDLKLPEEEQQPIGVWQQQHRQFLQKNKRATYTTLLTSGKLNNCLVDIEKQAEEMFHLLVKRMAGSEGMTGQLKADNPLEWVRRMNNIRNRSSEVINKDLIQV